MAKPNVWWPLKSVHVTGKWANSPDFYKKYGQKGHNGIDLRAATGTPVYAADAGTIRAEGWGSGNSWMGSIAGIYVLINHSWGISGYAHLSRTIINRGQKVKKGQLIGYSGATGVGTGPHLHFETFPKSPNFGNGFAGRVNPESIVTLRPYGWKASTTLKPNERKVGKNPVKRRSAPRTNSTDKKNPLTPNKVYPFKGWIRGEKVKDSVAETDIWYQGNSGDWFWAGGFTSRSTSGLADLNPAPPGQRQVDPVPVNVRQSATSTSKKTGQLAANSKVTPEGWVTGQSVQGNNIWYKLPSGYAWAGGFTKEDASGLKDLNPRTPDPAPPVDPEPPVEPEPSDVGPGPVLNSITGWDSESAPAFGTAFDRPAPPGPELSFPEVISEWTQVPEGGYYEGREGRPNHIVLHHAAQPNLEGALATLSGRGNSVPTANYVVKDFESVSMVPPADTPATNGRWKSNTYSETVEVCNDQTTTDRPSDASHETTAWITARAALRWGMRLPLEVGVNVFGHKDVTKSATACPLHLDVDWITSRANDILTEYQSPATGDLEGAIEALSARIDELSDTLNRVFK